MRLSDIKKNVQIEEEGATVTMFDPLGQPYTASDGSDVTVTVVGMQTKARRAAEAEEAKIARTIAEIDDEYVRQRRGRLAAACMTAWHGWETEDGQPIAFDAGDESVPYIERRKSIVAAITIDLRVLTQVEQGIERHASFFARQKKL